MVLLYAARHRVPVPSLARWLLGLGIAATLTASTAQGWSHGPVGAVVAAWPAVSLVGSYELSGLAHPHLRADNTRTVGRAPLQRCGLPCRLRARRRCLAAGAGVARARSRRRLAGAGSCWTGWLVDPAVCCWCSSRAREAAISPSAASRPSKPVVDVDFPGSSAL